MMTPSKAISVLFALCERDDENYGGIGFDALDAIQSHIADLHDRIENTPTTEGN